MKTRWFIGWLILVAASASWSGGDNWDSSAITAARRDLATRLKIPIEQVQVISRSDKTWPGTNMGCQRVGVKVSDVMTKGSELVLIAAGQQHFYHARPGQGYQYCVTPATKKTGAIKTPVQ